MNDERRETILFFDGVCLLCNGFVDFVLKFDRNQKIRLAPLQGEKAKELLSPELVEGLESMALYREGQILLRSDGALNVFKELGGIWSLAGIFLILPRGLRDWFYNRIANNRYKLFGKSEECRIPTAEERERFLD